MAEQGQRVGSRSSLDMSGLQDVMDLREHGSVRWREEEDSWLEYRD